MKPRIVIVGAGLGGAFVAHGLAGTYDITVVELGGGVDLQKRVRDRGAPAIIDPHVAAGPGGTSALWHNGLIEIEDEIFRTQWPFPKQELMPYYVEAFPLLSGVSIDVVERGAAALRQRYSAIGISGVRLPCLFYPRTRRNAWKVLDLDKRVRLVIGEAVDLETDGNNRISRLRVSGPGGEEVISGDAFVLAAGGLSTPLLLQRLATRVALPALDHAGRHYEDHPMAFVAELKMRPPLYRYWNFAAAGTEGNIRMPLVVRQDGLDVSFQIRPAANFYRKSRRERVHSIVTEIRNNRLNPLGYLRLLTHWDDVLDILSFEFGIRIPTRHYSLLMYAAQPPATERAIWGEIDPATGHRTIQRNWQLPPAYLATLDRAVQQVLDRLGNLVTGVNMFPNWHAQVHSAAHHSGTARFAASPAEGVCDMNARVHGLDNLYVADGSVIPGSGVANTGLTIAALALRLAKHLKATLPVHE